MKKRVNKYISIIFIIGLLIMFVMPLTQSKLIKSKNEFKAYVGKTIGISTDLKNCIYTANDTNKTITITKFDSSVLDSEGLLKVYGQYKIEDITYSTIIETSGEGSLFPQSLTNLEFWGEEVKWKGNAEYLFKEHKYLEVVRFGNINYIDTSNTSFKGMFSGCSKLVIVDFENANFERVTDISYMFENCENLNSLTQFGNFTASNVTDMSYMFEGCSYLTGIDVSKFNTSKVTNMKHMFNGCSSLTELNLDNFDTSKVTNIDAMFANCNGLNQLNLNNFNTSNVTSMKSTFSRCLSLTNLNINNWDTSKVEYMNFLFNECSSLTNININDWNTSSVYYMQGMFQDCSKLKSIDLNNWNTSNVTWTDWMFRGCSSLTDINIKDWDVSKVKTIGAMFSGCTSLSNIDISKWNNSISNSYDDMFKNCSKITRLDISNLEITSIAIADMFQGCNFDILVTPKAIFDNGDYPLPYVMYDDYGVEYTELPNTSKTLYKEKPVVKYRITLKTNGGTINSGNITEYTVGTETVLPIDVTKQGYAFVGWYDNESLTGNAVISISNTETGDKTFYAKWERIKFTVTFKDGEERTDVQTINSGEGATAPNWTKPGYTLSWDKAFNNVTSDLTVNAVWTPASGTAYKVEHYKQNTSLNGYDIVTADTKNLTGTTGETVTVTPNTYEGFTAKADNILMGTIAGDGSLVIKVYYDRNQYTVTFVSDGATAKTQPVTYGGSATAPELTKAGYTLSWDKAFNNITSDLTVNAVWIPASGTAYKVEHYKQNLNLDGYDIVTADTQNLTGTTGQSVTVTPNTYEGFTAKADNVLTGTITGDGNLVIKVYYDRNQYNITYYENGGTINEEDYVTRYTYGIGANLPSNVTKQGYNFGGWYGNSELTGNAIAQISTNDLGNKEYYAKWMAQGDTAYTVKHYKQVGNTDEYRLEETENLTAATGEQVTAVPKNYTGYIENTSKEERVPEGTVLADGTLELKLFYDTVKLTVTFKDGEETVSTQTVIYGENATPPVLTKDGYVLRWDKPYTNVTTDLMVNAQWLKDTDGDGIPDIEDDDTKVAYTVKHYKQVGNTNEYRLEETENLQGQLGSIVTAVAKAYEGYIENTSVTQRIPTGIVVEDGSLELRLFYDTIKLTVTFKDEEDIVSTQTVVYGANATAPSLTKEGYTLSWDKSYNNVTTNLTVNAVWTLVQVEPTQATYKVEHYLQTKTGYELRDTQNLTAKIGDTVMATAKTYASHNINKQIKETIESGVVTQDGKLVLKLYYDYKQFTVIFKDGDKVVSTQTVIYGGNATAPKLTKPGYILSWNKAINNITGDTTLLAVWTKDPNYIDPNDGKEERPSILPQTGEDIAMFMMVSGISMMIAGAGIIFYQKRKK